MITRLVIRRAARALKPLTEFNRVTIGKKRKRWRRRNGVITVARDLRMDGQRFIFAKFAHANFARNMAKVCG